MSLSATIRYAVALVCWALACGLIAARLVVVFAGETIEPAADVTLGLMIGGLVFVALVQATLARKGS